MQHSISTYTGKHFDPYYAEPKDICIEDIAHAQSLMTRANGHFPTFYSVAQHSISCCKEALAQQDNVQTALFCLLHDAAEVYMSDVTRPVKARMPEYVATEEKLLKIIFESLIGAQPDTAQWQRINHIDNAMLKAEFWHYKQEKTETETAPLLLTPDFRPIPCQQTEKEFLYLFHQLKQNHIPAHAALSVPEPKIIPFENKYRDDLIFMILEAKNALGRVPGLNPDLLDIQANYFDKGDKFWIALDDNDRVVGSVGFNTDKNSSDVTLHRLFVKCSLKHMGIGTALLQQTETYIKSQNKKTIYVNLGIGEAWFESRYFYTKHGYKEYAPNKMKKSL